MQCNLDKWRNSNESDKCSANMENRYCNDWINLINSNDWDINNAKDKLNSKIMLKMHEMSKHVNVMQA